MKFKAKTKQQRRWLLRGLVGGLLAIAMLAAWWSEQVRTAPDSVPAIIARDVWPWARWVLLAAVVVGVVAVVRRWVADRLPGRVRDRGVEERATAATAGLAGFWEIWRVTGWWALHSRARVLRPELTAGMSWHRRMRLPSSRLGVEIGRVLGGRFIKWVQRVYARVHENTMWLGVTQSGKTQGMSNIVADHDGPMLATSTNPNIVELTRAIREERHPGARIDVFNPLGVGSGPLVASTFRFNLLIGCESPATAIERAGSLLAGAPGMEGVGSREFWESKAVGLLSRLIHAAALGGHTPMDVLNWASSPDESKHTVMGLLAKSPSASAWMDAHKSFVDTNHNTRSSIITSVEPALSWLQDPDVATVVMPTGDDTVFNVEEWLRTSGTVYLLAEDRPHSAVAPLFSAFTTYIYGEAKKVASRSRDGRLDPPARMVLDEVANICPIPLDRWVTDSAGRGLGIDVGLQSLAQLYKKWGQHGGTIIWDNLTAKVIFGGFDEPKELKMFSEVCGSISERQADGMYRERPVMSVDRIRRLPQWYTLVLRRGMRPVITKVRPISGRRDIRAALRRRERAAQTQPARALAVAPEQGGTN